MITYIETAISMLWRHSSEHYYLTDWHHCKVLAHNLNAMTVSRHTAAWAVVTEVQHQYHIT